MATFWSNRGAERGPSFRGRVIFDTYRGKVRARAWPRAKKRRRTTAELEREEWFRQANYADRWAPALDKVVRRQATRNTVWMPRDPLVKQLAGQLIEPILPDGTRYRSMSLSRQASEALDYITDRAGALAVRFNNAWGGLPPANDGDVLTLKAGRPAWAAPQGSDGDTSSSAPPASQFDHRINLGPAVVTNGDTGAMVIYTDPSSDGVRSMLALAQISETPVTLMQRHAVTLRHDQAARAGLCIYDDASSHMIHWALGLDNSGQSTPTAWIVQQDYPTEYSQQQYKNQIITPNPGWIGLTLKDNNLHCLHGPDPEAMQTIHTFNNVSDYMTPTHIGPFISDSAESGVHIALAITNQVWA